MCWTCGCGELEKNHDDPRAITTTDLQGAAAQAGTDIPCVVANIVFSLSHFNPAMAKAGNGTAPYATCRVVKASSERQFTLGVAYPANKPDVSRAADGHRDFVSADVLEKTAWEWLTKYRDVNLFHKDRTSGHFTPTESYIWRGPDWTVASPVDQANYVVKAGDWMLGGIWDDEGWAMVKAGLINGWSPEGGARRRTPTAEQLAQLRS